MANLDNSENNILPGYWAVCVYIAWNMHKSATRFAEIKLDQEYYQSHYTKRNVSFRLLIFLWFMKDRQDRSLPDLLS